MKLASLFRTNQILINIKTFTKPLKKACLMFIELQQPYFEKLYLKVILKLFVIGNISRLMKSLLLRRRKMENCNFNTATNAL